MNFKKTLCLITLASSSLLAKSHPKTKDEPAKVETKQEQNVDIKVLSKSVGHLFSKTITDIGIHFNIDEVIQGLKEAAEGIPSPLSESECVSAITQEQKKSFDKLALKNLQEAETFLKEEATNKQVTVLDEGKVVYRVLKQGEGPQISDQGKIAIHYKGSLLNGEVFGESSKEEILEISQLVTGLRDAIAGMKEGEKRLIHIHPDKGYGTEGMLPPNSLLCFEIELAQAQVEEPISVDQQEQKQELESESQIR
jgi:peptidylprolyl isomerase